MLNTFSHLFTDFITNIEVMADQTGYFILFLLSLLEGIPIIGQFVPGHTLVILSGFLAKVNILDLQTVIILSIAGAMIGDVAGFLIGKKYGFNFLKKFGKYVFMNEERLNKVKELIYSNAGKTIILGRFSPFTRQLTPFIVGASGIHINKFWLFDFLGVFVWSIASVGIGYIFGASYHAVAEILGKFIVIAIILSILIIWGYHFINKQFHIFAKYELIVLGLNIGSLYVFFKTMQDALSIKSFMTEIDVWVNVFISLKLINSWCIVFMNFITEVFSPENLAVVSLVLLFYFIYKKQWKYVAITLFSTVGGLILGASIKELIMRTRPINSLILETGYSFPSGHAIAVTIFFTLIIYFFAKNIKNIIYRETFILLSIITIIIIAFSRLYLGVHWFSDAIAGISLGLFWTTLIILLIRYISMIFYTIKDKN